MHSSQCTGTLTILGLGGLAVAVILHAPMYILLAVKDCELNPMTPVPFSGGSMPAIARIAVLKVVSLVRGVTALPCADPALCYPVRLALPCLPCTACLPCASLPKLQPICPRSLCCTC